MKNLVYISSIGINDLIKKFSNEEDGIRFPNISAEYFGELINKYFSFSGFYNIDKSDKSNIFLRKLEWKKVKHPEDYAIFSLVFPGYTSALQSFANSGVSLVKGKLYSREFEGTLRNKSGKNYSIYITKEKTDYNYNKSKKQINLNETRK